MNVESPYRVRTLQESDPEVKTDKALISEATKETKFQNVVVYSVELMEANNEKHFSFSLGVLLKVNTEAGRIASIRLGGKYRITVKEGFKDKYAPGNFLPIAEVARDHLIFGVNRLEGLFRGTQVYKAWPLPDLNVLGIAQEIQNTTDLGDDLSGGFLS